ncbi:MAG: class I SAM-dependent methyltransferase [Candidatus Aenigmarchaeota archaeon]|nr:class I SAM-dependent methyltransferase [Candidatus Aenigmarchaeota archaeon]MDW8149522.1 class I SAM-dependent methyltransferase [Candidatus Aenigmarchaeota archaeon]
MENYGGDGMSKFRYGLHYLKWHQPTEAHYLEHMWFLKRIKEFLPKEKDAKILDLGCGIGCYLYCLKKLGYNNVKGIEIDRELAEIGKKANLDVEFVENSLLWLKERKETFDLILLLDVLEHIEKREQIDFLQAIYHSLKRGGKLILTVPNANSYLACRQRYNDWTHTSSFTEHSIEYILRNAGFQGFSILDIVPFDKLWIIRKLVRAISRMFLISEYGLRGGLKIPLSLNLLVVAWK